MTSTSTVEPIPVPVTPTGSPRRRGWLALAAGGALAAVGLGGLALLSGGSPPDADARLAGAQAFVESATSVRYTSRVETEDVMGAGTGGGYENTSWYTEEGEVDLAGGAWRVVTDFGDLAGEDLVVGDEGWSREADDVAGLADSPWVRWEQDELLGPWAELGSPEDLLDAVLAAGEAELVPGEGTVLTAEVDPVELGEAWEGVEEARLRLTLDGDRPTRFQLTVEGTLDGAAYASATDVRFTAWDEPVTLAAPAPEQVDSTPSFEEEAVAAAGIALYQPAALPEGWSLVAAYVLPPEDTVEGCTQVVLDYWGPGEADWVTLYQLPATCVGAEEAAGWVVTTTVGGTLVQADGMLSEADLEALLATLVPFDPATMVDAADPAEPAATQV